VSEMTQFSARFTVAPVVLEPAPGVYVATEAGVTFHTPPTLEDVLLEHADRRLRYFAQVYADYAAGFQ
jgi:hypothetical protein